MSEKRFLNFIFIEGILLTVLGLCILILPKLTDVTFGVMLSSTLIAYGLFKLVRTVLNRSFTHSFLCETMLSIFALTLGILLLLVPKINLLWLIALLGVYFLLESLSSIGFISQIRNVLHYIGCKYFSTLVLFLAGIIIVLGLPSIAFWSVAILSGLAFLIKGMAKIALSYSNKSYNRS